VELSFLIKALVQSNLVLLISGLLFIFGRRFFKGQNSSLVYWAQGILIVSILGPIVMQMTPQERMPTVKFVMPIINESAVSKKKIAVPVSSPGMKTAVIKVPPNNSFLQRLNLETVGFWALIVGYLIVVFRFSKNYIKLRRILLSSILIRKIGKIQIVVSDEISVPLSTKIAGSSWVVLPMEILNHKKDLKIAVMHELQHHRQRDTRWAMIMEWIVCFFYMNPAIYLWKKEITELQEYACDEAIIGRKSFSSHEYGSCLVRVAETALRNRQMHIGTMCMAAGSQNPIHFKSFLRRRIEMLSEKTKSSHKWTTNIFGTTATLLTVSIALGANQKINAADRINPGKATVNETIQKIAETVLKEEVENQRASAGFAIVADPNSGRILAIANVSKKNSIENWSLAERFEPASVVKTLVIAETIENGLTNPESKHNCENGSYTYNGRTYHDWKDVGWSELSTEETLTNSSNICAIKIGEKLGNDKIMKMLTKFGIGPGGVTKDFPGARAGLIPDTKDNSQLIPAVTSGFGMKMSPLEIVQAYGAIANGGNLMMPLPFDSSSQGEVVRRVLSPETTLKMKQMLRQVVVKGTGRISAESDLYTTAGKTGTGYIPDLTKYYLVEHATDKSNLAEFVGFAPLENPKIEVFVAIYEPKTDKGRAHGNKNAAPVFKRIVEQVLKEMKIAPDRKVE
jgi:beta-lactamase regulating signal transducer with metallopeptidase domain